MNNIAALHQLFKASSGICTDTRSIQAGNLFFALKGDNFNGNLYAEKALELGAAYSIVDEKIIENENLILVEDVLTTLQKLAAFHRDQLDIPIIAITGSNGKTTTKELIFQVLSKKFKTVATIGNLNNHIGVPLSLLSIKDDTEIAIIEMGANHQGEIASYCEWTRPTHGLISNIGLAHLEGFGGPEGVKKGKSELYAAVIKNEGKLFVNQDDQVLLELLTNFKNLYTYGASSNADVKGSIAPSSDNFLTIEWKHHQIKSQLVGDYNFMNIMSAVAIGVFFDVSEIDIVTAISNYQPDNNRSQIKVIDSNTFIMDAYNANPSSLTLAIQNFGNSTEQNKILIIGGMREMGDYSHEVHQDILNVIRQFKFDQIVLVGKEFESMLHENEGLYFLDSRSARDWWRQAGIKNHYILLKGSRGIALEKILE